MTEATVAAARGGLLAASSYAWGRHWLMVFRLGLSHDYRLSIKSVGEEWTFRDEHPPRNGPASLIECLADTSSQSEPSYIKATNIMLRIDDESILEDFEKAEQQSPSPEKVVGKNRTIYTSRGLRLPHDDLWGQPVLCDLGQARIGRAHTGLIQPEIYRAPEVLFDMGWGHSADIWNLGVMAWDIFEGRPLFSALDEDQEYSPSHHVADGDGGCSWAATVVLHPAKPGNSQCEWLGEGGVTIPNTSLERLEEKLNGNGQQSFLQFTRSMLQWTPETRKTAKELLKDPWRYS
ncbi:hypothetical protein KXV25_006868 [Aspergillus fumigatus]|nr:hypothetical protein KXW63_001626 [Aspergillus fumigatus]KAH2703818.1 hypothetical protein KXW03_002603 [Aspergillus fumigatus]KAH2742140.1 hypothetical protein KXW77_007028 [Aspergillus fumigatus]KAH2994817.1 hypothetical protein KXV25_006868 [Aspergillus fumigatus]